MTTNNTNSKQHKGEKQQQCLSESEQSLEHVLNNPYVNESRYSRDVRENRFPNEKLSTTDIQEQIDVDSDNDDDDVQQKLFENILNNPNVTESRYYNQEEEEDDDVEQKLFENLLINPNVTESRYNNHEEEDENDAEQKLFENILNNPYVTESRYNHQDGDNDEEEPQQMLHQKLTGNPHMKIGLNVFNKTPLKIISKSA
eukprot:CAMPEP_0195291494 /NCGR_PEP_ID=MMETSP0707-20130614/7827_1 /TAXON_ID=33640 /ORGANISM="Asterionellopsis glacialis, Strain CCMP134" /LENGTH=199 /DNA_ID=CAMNT_0040351813 /DNA_START=78 /DNA_END=677 /DNA_ORIENTATION=-